MSNKNMKSKRRLLSTSAIGGGDGEEADAIEQALQSQPRKRLRMEVLPMYERRSIPGKVLVCGRGDVGQLGLGDEENKLERRFPTVVEALENIVDFAAGGVHSVVLNANGDVYTFGCNDEGALGRATEVEGSEYVPGLVTLPGKGVMITAGDSHSACLLENGTVYAWGSFRNSHGNMGLTMEGNKLTPTAVLPDVRVVQIASGADHLVMLTDDSKLYTVGAGEQGQLGRVTLRSASGDSRRGNKPLLKPDIVTLRQSKPLRRIWATSYCTYAQDELGRILVFGLNNWHQLAFERRRKTASEIITNPVISKIRNVKEIAGGLHHTLVLNEDGQILVIGRNDYGRLGLGDVSEPLDKLTLLHSLADKTIVHVGAGDSTSFAVTADGKLYAWGMGTNHLLGTGQEDDCLNPTMIKSKQIDNKQVLLVSGGGQHSLFLVANNTSAENAATSASTNGANAEQASGSTTKAGNSKAAKTNANAKTVPTIDTNDETATSSDTEAFNSDAAEAVANLAATKLTNGMATNSVHTNGKIANASANVVNEADIIAKNNVGDVDEDADFSSHNAADENAVFAIVDEFLGSSPAAKHWPVSNGIIKDELPNVATPDSTHPELA